METIDTRVKEVIERENKALTQSELDSINKICETVSLFESIKPEYTISPKDTIGKNVYFNTVRR